MIQVLLEVIGGAKQTEVPLKQLPTVIGRGRDVSLTLPHPLVSRKHCELYEQQGHLFIKDLESLNGTYVNSQRIDGEQVLLPGQLLTLGNVTFRAIYEVPAEFQQLTDQLCQSATLEVRNRPAISDTPTASDTQPIGEPVENISIDQPEAISMIEKDTVYDDSKKKKQTVYQKNRPAEEADVARAASDTGTSLSDETSDSGVFSGELFVEEQESSGPERSVSMSALDDLPAAAANASFQGAVQVTEEKPVAADSFPDLQTGDDGGAVESDDSAIDSFIRKLPR